MIIGFSPTIDGWRSSLKSTYTSALEKSGAVPILLPYTERPHVLSEYARLCDGIIFTGGTDIASERYGESGIYDRQVCPKRDEWELDFFRIFFETGKPILGICRGMQLINVALGGTLWGDLESQLGTRLPHNQEPPYDKPSHRVRIIKDTPLYNILKKDLILTNSAHHQSVKRLGVGLSPMAFSTDGVTEAIYHRRHPFVIGVQWHPECSYESSEESREIFKNFTKSCCKTIKKQ